MSAFADHRRLGRRRRRHSLRWQLRVVRTLASTQFKLKFEGSILGYLWSVVRPLALFTILYFVFGRALRVGVDEDYPLFLLVGIVLFFFFSEATSTTLRSIVQHASLLRRLSFPRVVIPVSVSVTAFVTFAINVVVVMLFVAYNRIEPRISWIALLPLMVELYVFVLGLSLILATLYARFRDIASMWELATRVIFYGSAIIFPITTLPLWAQRVIAVNPFVQVMQDVRALILYRQSIPTVDAVYGTAAARPLIIVASVLTLAVGLLVFSRNESWFAERI
jgi:ABC-2 type transport system permease protein